MTDDEIRAQLDEALDVRPSPDFRTRVESRIAEEPELAAWRLTPRAALVASLTGAAALLAFWMATHPAAPDYEDRTASIAREASAPTSRGQGQSATTASLENESQTGSTPGGHDVAVATIATTSGVSAPGARHESMGAVASIAFDSAVPVQLSFKPAGPVRRIDLPPVLMPGDHSAGIVAFAELARSGVVPPERGVAPKDANESAGIPAIEIEPLKIEPMPQTARLESSRGVFP